MDKHVQRAHRDLLECKLPGCERSTSNFLFERFRAHLSDHHNIKASYSFEPIYAAKRGDESYFSNETFVTCKYCSEPTIQSNQNELSRNDTAL
jgi:hypothetical protein